MVSLLTVHLIMYIMHVTYILRVMCTSSTMYIMCIKYTIYIYIYICIYMVPPPCAYLPLSFDSTWSSTSLRASSFMASGASLNAVMSIVRAYSLSSLSSL